MSQYNISRQGADAFNRLAQQITTSYSSIRGDSQTLKNTVGNYQEELGPYYELIVDVITLINMMLNESEESAVLLHQMLLSSVAYIEERLGSINDYSRSM